VSNPNIPNPTATITQTTKFYVTYQDNCGCTITDSILVSKKVIDSLNILETPPTCGLDNGAIKFQVFGGASPYQFSIDSGKTLQPDSVFNGLNNMYLDLLVIDEEGCILTKRDTFTNTAPIIDS